MKKNEIIHSNINKVHGLEAHLKVRTSPTNRKKQKEQKKTGEKEKNKKNRKIKEYKYEFYFIFFLQGGGGDNVFLAAGNNELASAAGRALKSAFYPSNFVIAAVISSCVSSLK